MRPKVARNLRTISASLGLLACATAHASCSGVSQDNKKYWGTINAYKAATPVQHAPAKSYERRLWNLELTLSDGIRVCVKAADGPFLDSNVTVKYSDEIKERIVYRYHDYVYPADIRIEGSKMYSLVNGVAGGIWRETRLIVYDLSARKELHTMKVELKDLK